MASARIVRSLRWLVESRWQVSRTISNCWQDLGILGQYLGLLGSFVNCWAALGTVGNCLLFGILGKCWEVLGIVGKGWELLGSVGNCCELVGSVGDLSNCREMLRDFGKCQGLSLSVARLWYPMGGSGELWEAIDFIFLRTVD